MHLLIYSAPYILAILAGTILLSEWLQRFKIFRVAGAAILVIVITAILANIGVVPSGSNSTYSAIFDYIAPAAIFVLLLDVNLAELKKVGFPMLILFFIGTLGTTLGVLAATRFFPDNPLYSGFYAPIAGMFAGTYTGGALNFNAVALHYGVMEDGMVYASSVAVDNIITTVWMFVTISVPVLLNRIAGKIRSDKPLKKHEVSRETVSGPIGLQQFSLLIFLTVFCIWFSEISASWMESIGFQVPSILIVTTLALILAQLPAVSRLPGTRLIGSWLVFLFLSVVGAFCDIGALYDAGQLAIHLFGFVSIILVVHGALMFIAGKWIIRDWDLVAIASQANIGGSTTAMALAQSFNRYELVLPAIIIGSLGNALGTYIGFLVAAIV